MACCRHLSKTRHPCKKTVRARCSHRGRSRSVPFLVLLDRFHEAPEVVRLVRQLSGTTLAAFIALERSAPADKAPGSEAVRHCLCLVFPLPSRLRQCLSLRSSGGDGRRDPADTDPRAAGQSGQPEPPDTFDSSARAAPGGGDGRFGGERPAPPWAEGAAGPAGGDRGHSPGGGRAGRCRGLLSGALAAQGRAVRRRLPAVQDSCPQRLRPDRFGAFQIPGILPPCLSSSLLAISPSLLSSPLLSSPLLGGTPPQPFPTPAS